MSVRPTSRTRRRLHRHGTVPEAASPEIQVTDRRGAEPPVSPPGGERAAGAGEVAQVAAEIAQAADGDRSQDEATYRCGCGYVFDAVVTTSVACPYCGDAQAW